MHLLPNSLSFRVITTIDVTNESTIPKGFSGRVRVHADDVLQSIQWYHNGRLQDPARRMPAYVAFRPNGHAKQERHYRDGRLNDPDPGVPAVRGFFDDGSQRYEEHYREGRRHDGTGGRPAIVKWRLDGSVRTQLHYRDGRRLGWTPHHARA